jgi:hypothetical protein
METGTAFVERGPAFALALRALCGTFFRVIGGRQRGAPKGIPSKLISMAIIKVFYITTRKNVRLAVERVSVG